MRKKFPLLKSDEEAEAFLQQDLSDYIHRDNFAPFHFEFRAKDKSISLRLPKSLLTAVRAKASRHGIPYQRYIRHVLEHDVHQDSPATAAARTKARGAKAGARGRG
jgi:predicted DNA binding CopG/RHH family protein